MEEKREKYLPLGTVVLLENGTHEIMITGFSSVDEDEPQKIYDYTGCVYPEGNVDSEEVCLFDHEQIQKISFLGYETEASKKYNEEIKEAVREYEEKNNSDTTSTDVSINNDTEEVSGPVIIEESNVTEYETLG